MNADLLSLKLYVDDKNEVWYINNDGPPTATHATPLQFLLYPMSIEMPRIRIVGFHQNINLILALLVRQIQRGTGTIEVCSPSVCKTAADSKDPYKTLYAMRQFDRAGSMGGWHRILHGDYTSFALASHMQKTNGEITDRARCLIKNHPVWLPLSFIPHLNIDACIKLLALVIDPRWFINPLVPTRGSRLRSYLGLDLKTMAGVLGKGPKQRYDDRCRLVLESWQWNINPKMIEKPDNFLPRIMRAAFEKKGCPTYATLRTSQAFIEYLRLCWIAAVGRVKHQNEALFVPEHYFNESYETAAFYAHFTKMIGST